MKLEAFKLVVFESDEVYPPNFWNKYNTKKLSQRLSGGTVCADYGVTFRSKPDSKRDYYIGIRAHRRS